MAGLQLDGEEDEAAQQEGERRDTPTGISRALHLAVAAASDPSSGEQQQQHQHPSQHSVIAFTQHQIKIFKRDNYVIQKEQCLFTNIYLIGWWTMTLSLS